MPRMKGRFKPNNPKKYKGDPSNIIYRSGWELRLMSFLDKTGDIEWWQSEEISIPYRSPLDNKLHRYYPDFLIKKMNGEKLLIEVKPEKQTKAPDPAKKHNTPTGRVSRRYLNEVKTWGVNKAKWQAASEFCTDRGWKFVIMTEKDLFGKG